MEQSDTLLQGGTLHAPHDTIPDGPARYCGYEPCHPTRCSGAARSVGWPRLGERRSRLRRPPPPRRRWCNCRGPYWRASRGRTGWCGHEQRPRWLLRLRVCPSSATPTSAATSCIYGASGACRPGWASGVLLRCSGRILLRLVRLCLFSPRHTGCGPEPEHPPHGRSL